MSAYARVLFSSLLLFATTALAAAGYPSVLEQEIPLYPQAQLDSASEYPQGASVVINTASPVEQAARYYHDQLTEKGWEQTAAIAIGNAHALEFSRQRSSIAISIVPTPAGTTISLSLNH
jgi:hypothetical protein